MRVDILDCTLGSGTLGTVKPGILNPGKELVAVKVINYPPSMIPDLREDADASHVSLSRAACTQLWHNKTHTYAIMPLYTCSAKDFTKQMTSRAERELLTVSFLLDILPQLASLHHNNMGHGDVKLANIVYRQNAFALTDFEMTRTEGDWPTSFCTPGMLSPEIFVVDRGHYSLSKLDVWGAGMCAFELAAGYAGTAAIINRWKGAYGSIDFIKAPQKACDALVQMGGLTGQGIPDDPYAKETWRDALPAIAPRLLPIIDAALATDPAKRPGAADLLSTIQATYPDSMQPQDLRKHCSRAYRLASLGAAAERANVDKIAAALAAKLPPSPPPRASS